MVGIYKITNQLNGLCYIGQSINIYARWRQHVNEVKINRSQSKLYQAMREYGIENFVFEIIEKCEENQQILNEREIYWIEYYNSYENGYNSTHGGQEGTWVFDTQLIQQLWDEGFSVQEIRDLVGCGKTTIQNKLKGYKDYNCSTSHSRGLLRSRKNKEYDNLEPNRFYIFSESQKEWFSPMLPVYQYSLQGDFIAEYPSLGAAARALGKPNSDNIGHALLGIGGQRIAYNFQWSREKVKKMPPTNSHCGQMIRCIETGEVFPSITEATKWCGLKSHSNIREYLIGKYKSAGKHPVTGEKLHWEYYNN